jgi:hypothetical protein
LVSKERRYAISACCTCLALRSDPVRLTGEPDDWWWFGVCAACGPALRWFEVVGFVVYTWTPVKEKAA